MIFQYGGENSYIDHINPIGTGFLIFHDTNNNYNCGVANDAGTYKTVGLSFELGGLIDAGAGNTRQDLLDSIMGFFEITTEVEEITKLDVKAPLMQLSPNPYRTTTTIRYSILDSRYSTQNPLIKIYDASGRLVKSIDLASSIQNQESTISWHGDDNAGRKLSAGVYFVQLQTDTHTESQKAILIE
jgi:hypothetical protein